MFFFQSTVNLGLGDARGLDPGAPVGAWEATEAAAAIPELASAAVPEVGGSWHSLVSGWRGESPLLACGTRVEL